MTLLFLVISSKNALCYKVQPVKESLDYTLSWSSFSVYFLDHYSFIIILNVNDLTFAQVGNIFLLRPCVKYFHRAQRGKHSVGTSPSLSEDSALQGSRGSQRPLPVLLVLVRVCDLLLPRLIRGRLVEHEHHSVSRHVILEILSNTLTEENHSFQ